VNGKLVNLCRFFLLVDYKVVQRQAFKSVVESLAMTVVNLLPSAGGGRSLTVSQHTAKLWKDYINLTSTLSRHGDKEVFVSGIFMETLLPKVSLRKSLGIELSDCHCATELKVR